MRKRKSPPAPPGTIPLAEYAERHGVSRTQVHNWISYGQLSLGHDYERRGSRYYLYLGAEPKPGKQAGRRRICVGAV